MRKGQFWYAGLAGLFFALSTMAQEFPPSASADEQLAIINQWMIAGDEARDKGQTSAALEEYTRAIKGLTQLQSQQPTWQPGIIQFRLAYCQDQLPTLQQTTVQDGAAKAATNAAVDPAAIRRQAIELLKNSQPEQALDLLVKGLQSHPDNIPIRLLTGIVQCRLKKYEESIFMLEELAQEQPKNPAVHLALSGAYLGTGRADDAKKELQCVLNQEPQHSLAHFNSAWLLVLQNPVPVEEVRTHYQAWLSQGGAPDATLAEITR
jgi:tetratricopeptide (TPR) repeat protein